MHVNIKGKVEDCYEKPLFVNKETGEAGEKRFAIQVMTVVPLKNGQTKKDLVDVNIKEDGFNKYKSLIGKEIELTCSLYSKSAISLTSI